MLSSGGETGLQWLPLRVPGNVRIIVTATHPDPNYLQIHEQRIRQHMVNPHLAVTSQSPEAGSSDTGVASNSESDRIGDRGQNIVETGGEGEAKYQSSHRRRKVRNDEER